MGHGVDDGPHLPPATTGGDALRNLPGKIPEAFPPLAGLPLLHKQPSAVPQDQRCLTEFPNRSCRWQVGNIGNPILLPGHAGGRQRAGLAAGLL